MGRNALIYEQMTEDEVAAYREYGRRKYHKQEQTDRTKAAVRRYNELRRRQSPETHRRYQRDYLSRCRQETQSVLGTKCAQCGVGGPPGFLDVDHINNDGHLEKGRHKYPSGPPNGVMLVARKLREENEEAVKAHYQLLCPNCHRLKTIAARATEESA